MIVDVRRVYPEDMAARFALNKLMESALVQS